MQVFNNQYTQADIWDMQGAVISFGSSSTGSMPDSFSNTFIAIGLQLGFGRQITKRYPINVRRAIFQLGTPTGTLSMNLLFGPSATISQFLQNYGGAAADTGLIAQSTGVGGTQTIEVRPFGKVIASSGNASPVGQNLGIGTWKIISPIISNIGLSVSESGNSQIPAVASVTMDFVDLQIDS